MKHDKILIPYDGSDSAKNAVAYAMKILEDAPEAKLVIFSSLAGPNNIEKLMGTGREGTGFVEDGTRAHYEKVREKSYNRALERMEREISEIAGGKTDPFEYVIEFHSSPVKGILSAAEKYGVDAIYMGCRGVSAIAGMLGSVSFGVIRSAAVPVTVVK